MNFLELPYILRSFAKMDYLRLCFIRSTTSVYTYDGDTKNEDSVAVV